MKRVLKWIGYAVYAVGVTGVFLYFLFPAEAVRQYTTNELARRLPELDIDIDKVHPDLPAALAFRSISVARGDKALVGIEKFKIVPGPLSAIRPEKSFTFKGWTCEGTVSGKTTLVPSTDTGRPGSRPVVDAVLAGIQIQGIEAIQRPSDYKISGVLAGNISYDGIKGKGTGSADLILADGVVEVVTPLFNMPALSFPSIRAGLDMTADGKINITECEIKGREINGTISGDIILKAPIGGSRLNISGTFKPHPSFFTTLKQGVLSLIFKDASKRGEFSIRITGTIDKPSYSRR